MAREVVRFRPRRIRVVAWVAAVIVVLAAVALAAALSGPAGASAPEGIGAEGYRTAAFGPEDRAGLVGLGVIGAAALLLLTRPLVVADPDGIWVRNIVGGWRLPWPAVRRVRFDHGASWATLELHDGEVLGVLAIQAVDKEHAVAAVRTLRALHAADAAHQ